MSGLRGKHQRVNFIVLKMLVNKILIVLQYISPREEITVIFHLNVNAKMGSFGTNLQRNVSVVLLTSLPIVAKMVSLTTMKLALIVLLFLMLMLEKRVVFVLNRLNGIVLLLVANVIKIISLLLLIPLELTLVLIVHQHNVAQDSDLITVSADVQMVWSGMYNLIVANVLLVLT